MAGVRDYGALRGRNVRRSKASPHKFCVTGQIYSAVRMRKYACGFATGIYSGPFVDVAMKGVP